jgi:hypothetical protein
MYTLDRCSNDVLLDESQYFLLSIFSKSDWKKENNKTMIYFAGSKV